MLLANQKLFALMLEFLYRLVMRKCMHLLPDDLNHRTGSGRRRHFACSR